MRITFLTHFPGRGGSTSMLLQLSRYFREAGHHLEIIAGADCENALLNEYTVFKPTPGRDWRQLMGDYKKLVESSRPEVVYVISGMMEAELLRFLEVPRTQHVFTVERHEFLDSALWVNQHAPYWEACSANTPDVFSFVKQSKGFDGIELDLPYNINPAFQHVLEPSHASDPVQVCLISRLERFQKRVNWLPKINEELQKKGISVQWHVYGDGPAGGELKAKLHGCGANNVVFHGWRTPEEMAALIPRHDIFFSCSRFEGLPVSMIEAMFSGLACVVPVLPGGIQFILQHGGGFGYSADSPLMCAQALMNAAGDKARLKLKKQEALKVAHSLFGSKVVRPKYETLEARLRMLTYNGRHEDLGRASKCRNVNWLTYLRRRIRRLSRET